MSGEAWFRPKRFGYGATPSNWKGWAFLAGMVIVLFGAAFLTLPSDREAFLALLFIWLVIVSVVAKAKSSGEWRLRWGGQRSGDR